VSRAARSDRHSPSDQECELSHRAAAAVGTAFAVIDLLSGSSLEADAPVPFVIEVNGVPGWRAFNRVNDCDTAAELVRFLEA